MFKKLIAAAVTTVLSFTPALADQKMDDLIAATPQINGNCTATVIYSKRDEKSGDVKTVLLTAKHCVDQSSESDQIVEFPVYQNNRIVKKEKFIGKVLGTHFKSDLGLIELKDKKTLFEKTAKLAPSDLTQSLGDPTTVLGYSLGMAITVTHGTFGGLETIDWPKAGTEFLRATPMIAPGNSGGPLYVQNKAGDYELAGVTTALAGNITSFIGFYTPSTMIHEYLKVALPELVANK